MFKFGPKSLLTPILCCALAAGVTLQDSYAEDVLEDVTVHLSNDQIHGRDRFSLYDVTSQEFNQFHDYGFGWELAQHQEFFKKGLYQELQFRIATYDPKVLKEDAQLAFILPTIRKPQNPNLVLMPYREVFESSYPNYVWQDEYPKVSRGRWGLDQKNLWGKDFTFYFAETETGEALKASVKQTYSNMAKMFEALAENPTFIKLGGLFQRYKVSSERYDPNRLGVRDMEKFLEFHGKAERAQAILYHWVKDIVEAGKNWRSGEADLPNVTTPEALFDYVRTHEPKYVEWDAYKDILADIRS